MEYPRNRLAHVTVLAPPPLCPKSGSVLELMRLQTAITQTLRSHIFLSIVKQVEIFLPQVFLYLALQLLQCDLFPNHLRLQLPCALSQHKYRLFLGKSEDSSWNICMFYLVFQVEKTIDISLFKKKKQIFWLLHTNNSNQLTFKMSNFTCGQASDRL